MRISDWSSDVCSSDLGTTSIAHVDRIACCIDQPASTAIPVARRTKSMSTPSASWLTMSKERSRSRAKLPSSDTIASTTSAPAKGSEQLLTILDRKSVVKGKSVSVRVDLGVGRLIKQKNHQNK